MVSFFAGAGAVQAAAPVIANSGTSQWMESASGNDDARQVNVTFVVRHDVGRRITGIVRDDNFDGTDNTGSNGTVSVTPQEHVSGRIASSVVRYQYAPPKPGGFSCPFVGSATRRVDVPLRFRVVDDGGQRSASVSQSWHVVENNDCGARTDYPVLEAWGGGSSGTTPGTPVGFSFRCDDDDSSGTNDACDYLHVRWRRLNDGATQGLADQNADDNTDRSFSVSFPSRGVYVVEAELCGESNCSEAAGRWWRIGSAVVNESANPSLSLGTLGTVPSSPPSVNAGDGATVRATVGDASPGRAQVLEWDSDGAGGYDRWEFEAALTSLSLDGGQLDQAVPTATPGLKTVGARVTDNGAIDASDDAARSATATQQVRVNARPTAADRSAATAEDTTVDITLPGSDADDQPQALAYDVVTQPANGSVTLSGGTARFTPAPNWSGTTTFTYRARDGVAGLNAAWATSNTATVTVTASAVNDLPTAGDVSLSTDEDTPVAVALAGVDADGDELSYAVSDPRVSCDGDACTFTPAANASGTTSFDYTVSDGNGGTDTGRVTIDVAPVNDAPVVDDTAITTDEDTAVTFTPPASDVDDATLTLSASDPEHGSVSCTTTTCTYTPDGDFHGHDGLDVTATDGTLSDSGHIDIEVASINDTPVAAMVTATTAEDTALELDLVATDVDGDELSYAATGDGLACDEDGRCTYTPAADFHGDVSFAFTVTDGHGGTDEGRLDITVTPVNDAPTAEDVAFSTDEDTAATFVVPAGDVDGDALTATASDPDGGTASCDGLLCTYSPDQDRHGDDAFTVTVSDGELSDTVRVDVDVRPVNDAPVATPLAVATDEDTPRSFTLAATDVDGDALTYAVADRPAHGAVECNGTGECVYAPAADRHGPDTFTFTARDADGAQDTATVSVEVRPVNDAPEAQAGTLQLAEDTTAGLGVIAVDRDGDELTYALADGPQHGSATCSANGFCSYTPASEFHGADAFTFRAKDPSGATTEATVAIVVTPVNDPPVLADRALEAVEDTALAFTVSGDDVDGDDLAYAVGEDPAHGTVACSGDGACTYTPARDFYGADRFRLVASDGAGGSDEARVTVTVTPVNDAPTAADATATTDEDEPVELDLPVADVDGDALTVTPGEVVGGTVDCTGTSCTFTPTADAHGTASFPYVVRDAEGAEASAKATITIRPVNDPPVAADVTVSTDEDTPVALTLIGTDVDGDALSWSVVGRGDRGVLSCTDAGACTYAPDTNAHGSDEVRVRADDGHGATDEAVVGVTVRPVNDAPVAPDVRATTDEDHAVTFDVPATDADEDVLSYAVADAPAAGAATCTTAGRCTYTPQADRHGEDAFTYRAEDGHGGVTTGRAVVTVRPVNDPPTARDSRAATEEDTPVAFVLDATDIDDLSLEYTITDTPDHGTLSCDGGRCTYTPEADWFGEDELTFTARDAAGATASATVRLAVTEIRYTTRMAVDPVVLTGFGLLFVEPRFSARLTRGDGSPVGGRKVTFAGSNGQAMCTATTGADGRVVCTRRLTMPLAELQALTYTAVFAGDGDHEASSNQARLVQTR